MLSTHVSSSETTNSVKVSTRDVQTSDRRTGAKSIDNRHLPDVAVARSSPRCPVKSLQTEKSRIMFQAFDTPSKSNQNVVRDEEHMDVEDMSHCDCQPVWQRSALRTGRGREEWRRCGKTMHGGHLDQNTQDEVRSEREGKERGALSRVGRHRAGPASVHQVGLGSYQAGHQSSDPLGKARQPSGHVANGRRGVTVE